MAVKFTPFLTVRLNDVTTLTAGLSTCCKGSFTTHKTASLRTFSPPFAGVFLPKGRIYTLSHLVTGMSEWTAVRRVGLRRVGKGVFAESVDVLAAARRKVFEVRFVDGAAPGLSLPQHLLPVHRVPKQHAVGQQRQAPGRFALSLRLLAAADAFAAKPEPGPPHAGLAGVLRRPRPGGYRRVGTRARVAPDGNSPSQPGDAGYPLPAAARWLRRAGGSFL